MYVGQLELLAAVAVYYSLAAELRGREVIHFIDNSGAMACLIKCPPMASDLVAIGQSDQNWSGVVRSLHRHLNRHCSTIAGRYRDFDCRVRPAMTF